MIEKLGHWNVQINNRKRLFKKNRFLTVARTFLKLRKTSKILLLTGSNEPPFSCHVILRRHWFLYLYHLWRHANVGWGYASLYLPVVSIFYILYIYFSTMRILKGLNLRWIEQKRFRGLKKELACKDNVLGNNNLKCHIDHVDSSRLHAKCYWYHITIIFHVHSSFSFDVFTLLCEHQEVVA